MSDSPTYVTVAELAKRLNRSTGSIYRACKLGQIPGAFLLGRKWLINIDAFDEATASSGRLVEV